MKNLEKQITRTISIYRGEEVKANFETMTFDLVPFEVYEENAIPANVKNLTEEEVVFTMNISDFVKYGKKVEKNV